MRHGTSLARQKAVDTPHARLTKCLHVRLAAGAGALWYSRRASSLRRGFTKELGNPALCTPALTPAIARQ
jgi:hypothetical protein